MNLKKTLCLTLIASLALSACDNQTGSGGAGQSPLSKNAVLNLKDNVGLTDTDYRQDIFELNDVAVFDESGVKSGVFYLDSTKGVQVLNSAIIPKDALNDNTKFLEFMKANKDKFTAIAASYPKPDNSLAMYYDKSHNTIHWLALNDAKTKWQEYGIDVSKNQPMISMLQESDIDPNISKENLAVSFRASGVEGETIVDVTYAESDLATDLDGQPVNGVAKISYLARVGIAAASESMLLNNQVYTPVLLGVNGILENSYIYDGNGTTEDEANVIKKLYPEAKVGEFTEHKPGFMDTLRNLSPILALTVIVSFLGGVYSLLKRNLSAKELKNRTENYYKKTQEVNKTGDVKDLEAEKVNEVVGSKLEDEVKADNDGPNNSLVQDTTSLDPGLLFNKAKDIDTFLSLGGEISVAFIQTADGQGVRIQDVTDKKISDIHPISPSDYSDLRKLEVFRLEDINKAIKAKLVETTTNHVSVNELKTNIKNIVSLNDDGANGIPKTLLEMKYGDRNKKIAINAVKHELKLSTQEGIPRQLIIEMPFEWRDVNTFETIIKEFTGEDLTRPSISEGGKKITYKTDLNFTKDGLKTLTFKFENKLTDIITSDFDIVDASGRLSKRYPIVAATVSAGVGTSIYFEWKDDFGKFGSWVFGGCSKYVCNSIFLYGNKSSESSIGLKSDALFQQVPFTNKGKNYILNIAQVFAQTCVGMINTSSESQTKTLYAGDSDLNVGKHYLVSDVNNKLCPIGDMDINKFIESVGVAQ
jgi:hypothetical protein